MLLLLLHLFPQCQHGFRGFGLGGRSPIFAVIIRGIGSIISRKHMRMTGNELVHQSVSDLINTERILGVRFADPRLEHGLQQHITQFLAHIVAVVSFHRVNVFVSFFEQILEQRLIRLLAIPGQPPGEYSTSTTALTRSNAVAASTTGFNFEQCSKPPGRR